MDITDVLPIKKPEVNEHLLEIVLLFLICLKCTLLISSCP